MAQSAQVHSVELLRDFHAALCNFAEKTREALTAAEMEIHRTFDWLQEQARYWQHEIRKRQDAMAEARNALARKEMPNALGNIPDCTVEKKALARAKQRLADAEDKLAVVRRWVPRLQREVDEYQGPARQLANCFDGDPPRSIALVARKIVQLEAYLGLSPSSSAQPRGEQSEPRGSESSESPPPAGEKKP